MAQPKCSGCGSTVFAVTTAGAAEQVVLVVYCESCGHVIGVSPHSVNVEYVRHPVTVHAA